MWCILALEIGATKDELKARMSAQEFAEWQVFYAIRPFGPWHDDFRIATLNWSVGQMIGSNHLKPKDYRCIQPSPKVQSNEEIARIAREAMRE